MSLSAFNVGTVELPGRSKAFGLGSERRRSERVPHVVDAWIVSPTATDADERVSVHCVNLSRHGVAFALPTPVATGTFHIIEIALGSQKLLSEVRIMDCRKMEDGQFEVGAEFC